MEKRLYENLTEKPGDPVLPRQGGAPEWGEDFEEGEGGPSPVQGKSKLPASCERDQAREAALVKSTHTEIGFICKHLSLELLGRPSKSNILSNSLY